MLEELQQRLVNWILKVTVGTLSAIIAIVVIVLAISLFLPTDQVDNQKIFEIIGPAFNTVIGAFVGLLGGLSLTAHHKPKEEPLPCLCSEPEDDLGPHPDYPDRETL
jgi:hypothetical protein